MKEKIRKFGSKYPLVFGIIALLVALAAIQYPFASSYLAMGVVRAIASAILVLIFLLAFGTENLRFPGKGWKESFRIGRGLIISTALIGFLVVFVPLLKPDGASGLVENWVSILLSVVFMTLMVGAVEELTFRQGLFVTLEKQLSRSKNGPVIAAVISSLVFGFIHVVGSLSADPVGIASAVLKTVQTGMMGFILCGAVYKTKNLWPAALIHGLNDMFLLLQSIWGGEGEIGNYVSTSAEGIRGFAKLGMFLIFILIYLPGTIRSYRILTGKPDRRKKKSKKVLTDS